MYVYTYIQYVNICCMCIILYAFECIFNQNTAKKKCHECQLKVSNAIYLSIFFPYPFLYLIFPPFHLFFIIVVAIARFIVGQQKI